MVPKWALEPAGLALNSGLATQDVCDLPGVSSLADLSLLKVPGSWERLRSGHG